MCGRPTKGAGHFTICEGSGVRARIYDTAATVSERARDHMTQHFRDVGAIRAGDRVLYRRADQPDRAGTVSAICGDGRYCVDFDGPAQPPIRGAALRLPCGSPLSWTCDTALLCDSDEGRALRRLITTHVDDFDITAPPHRIPGYFRLALRHWRRLPAATPSLYGDMRRHATEEEWFGYWRLTSKANSSLRKHTDFHSTSIDVMKCHENPKQTIKRLGYARISVPDDAIDLLIWIDERAEICVVTAHGRANAPSILGPAGLFRTFGRGFGQGSRSASPGWRCISDVHLAMQYDSVESHSPVTLRGPSPGSVIPLAAVLYEDDSQLFSSSRPRMMHRIIGERLFLAFILAEWKIEKCSHSGIE